MYDVLDVVDADVWCPNTLGSAHHYYRLVTERSRVTERVEVWITITLITAIFHFSIK